MAREHFLSYSFILGLLLVFNGAEGLHLRGRYDGLQERTYQPGKESSQPSLEDFLRLVSRETEKHNDKQKWRNLRILGEQEREFEKNDDNDDVFDENLEDNNDEIPELDVRHFRHQDMENENDDWEKKSGEVGNKSKRNDNDDGKEDDDDNEDDKEELEEEKEEDSIDTKREMTDNKGKGKKKAVKENTEEVNEEDKENDEENEGDDGDDDGHKEVDQGEGGYKRRGNGDNAKLKLLDDLIRELKAPEPSQREDKVCDGYCL
ncbi:nucleolin-like [Saccostrea cucullata]|uniref:nucleolin-like n=1 Tax=Saccostrea cuccullata TaxID=36930 RepID=UPI002ED352F0